MITLLPVLELLGASGTLLFWVLKRAPRLPVVGGVGTKLLLFGLVRSLLEVEGGVGTKSLLFSLSGFFLNLSLFLLPLSLGLFVPGEGFLAPFVFAAGKFAKLGERPESLGLLGLGSALVESF